MKLKNAERICRKKLDCDLLMETRKKVLAAVVCLFVEDGFSNSAGPRDPGGNGRNHQCQQANPDGPVVASGVIVDVSRR